MERVLVNSEASSLLEEAMCQMEKCKAMVSYLCDELGEVKKWETNYRDRIELKKELRSFADIAHDYLFDAHKKIEYLMDAAELIKEAPAPTTAQGEITI